MLKTLSVQKSGYAALSRGEYSYIMRLKMGNGETQYAVCVSQFPCTNEESFLTGLESTSIMLSFGSHVQAKHYLGLSVQWLTSQIKSISYSSLYPSSGSTKAKTGVGGARGTLRHGKVHQLHQFLNANNKRFPGVIQM